MTTAALTRSATRAEPGYSFRSATRMEWLKLRSVRSTSWILLVFAVGMIGLSVLVLSHEHWATIPPASAPPSTRSTRASPAWRSASSSSASSACSRSRPSSPRA